MAEIEVKYIVSSQLLTDTVESIKNGGGSLLSFNIQTIKQCYISSSDNGIAVRLRVTDQEYPVMCVKHGTTDHGLFTSCDEHEAVVVTEESSPLVEALFCNFPSLQKTRIELPYVILDEAVTLQIDTAITIRDNELPISICEVEFESPEQAQRLLPHMDWIGRVITGKQWSNRSLASMTDEQLANLINEEMPN